MTFIIDSEQVPTSSMAEGDFKHSYSLCFKWLQKVFHNAIKLTKKQGRPFFRATKFSGCGLRSFVKQYFGRVLHNIYVPTLELISIFNVQTKELSSLLNTIDPWPLVHCSRRQFKMYVLIHPESADTSRIWVRTKRRELARVCDWLPLEGTKSSSVHSGNLLIFLIGFKSSFRLDDTI